MTNIEFHDVDDYIRALVNLNIHGTQLTSGQFLCRHRSFQLPKMTIGDRFFSTAALFHTMINEDNFYIFLPNIDIDGVSVNGKEILAGSPLVFVKNQEILLQIPKGYPTYHVIVISPQELSRYYGSENTQILKKRITEQGFDKSIFFNKLNVLNTLSLIIDDLLKNGTLLNYKTVMAAQEKILCLLSDLLELNPLFSLVSSTKQLRQYKIVSRALSSIHISDTLSFTIPELAKASFCCVRSLEYSFKAVTGMTPKQYIIKRKLQSIRSLLNTNKNDTIEALTKQYGITNQGRFSQDYFKFFNEYPHDTRSR